MKSVQYQEVQLASTHKLPSRPSTLDSFPGVNDEGHKFNINRRNTLSSPKFHTIKPKDTTPSTMNWLHSSTNPQGFGATSHDTSNTAGEGELNQLKKGIYEKHKHKISKPFLSILISDEYEQLLLKALDYCKAFVNVSLLQKQREQSAPAGYGDISDSVMKTIASIVHKNSSLNASLNENASTISKDAKEEAEENILQNAKAHMESILKDFSKAYCFLLLHTSNLCPEKTKERIYFENIYFFIKETVCASIGLAFSPLVNGELNRLFRSVLFANAEIDSHAKESGEPNTTTQATTKLDTPLLTKNASWVSNDRSSKYGKRSTSPGKINMKTMPKKEFSFMNQRASIVSETHSPEGESIKEPQPDTTPLAQHETHNSQPQPKLVSVKRGPKLKLNQVRLQRTPLAETFFPAPARFCFS